MMEKIQKKIKVVKDEKTNSVKFYTNGQERFDFTIKGNIVKFSDGVVILI